MPGEDRQPAFADLLRRARRAAGLTQEGLAERAGLSTRAVSDLERGLNRTPRRDTLELLAEALELSVEERRAWERTRRRDFTRARVPAAPQLATDAAARTNVPVPLTSLIGREQAIEQVTRLLRQAGTRLVTLTGPGGVGKTRLAIAVGQALLDEQPDGVWFVDLAPLNDPNSLLTVVATTLQLPVAGSRPALATLVDALRTKRRLLVLDNVEHLVAATPVLGDLLAACPHVSILITSRVPLRLAGEQEYLVEPLALPGPAEPLDISRLQQVAAVTLFIQRAQAIKPDFAVTPDNAAAVAAICHRLDGLPLAIELAAARIRLLPAQALLSRLDHRLALLRSDVQNVPSRQRTLRDTIAWSYDLLTTDAQALFRRQAVFHGGWVLQAAEDVAGSALGLDILDGLEQLVEHSLIRVGEQPGGTARFSMLETIRAFGLEQLEAQGEAEMLRQRHLDHYLALAEHAEPYLKGAEQAYWIGRLDEEHANLRAALHWSSERGKRGDAAATMRGLRLAGALWWFWWVRGYMREGRDQLTALVELVHGATAGERHLPPSDEMATAYAKALFGLATLSHWLADYARSRKRMTECLEIYRRLGHTESVASALMFLGYMAQHMGDFDEAHARISEATAIYRERGDNGGIALGLLGWGEMALRVGDYQQGASQLTESIARFTDVADARGVAAARATLGAIRLHQGDLAQAATLLRQSLVVRHELGDKGGIAWCLERVAELVLATADTPANAMRAARLLGAAREIRIGVGAGIDPADQAQYERVVAASQAPLSELAFAAAWEAGRAMTIEQVIGEADQGAVPS